MKIFSKKSAAALIALSMICSSAAIPQIIYAEGTSNAPVISVTFDDGGDAYTLHGGILTDGRDGKALSLDGNEQYADINSAASKLASISGDYTISVWCNPSQISTWSRIYDLGNDTSNYVFLTTSNGSLPRYAVKKSGTELYFDSENALTTGSWHNVTITKANNICTFYLDGVATGKTTGVATNLSELGEMSNLYLGKSQWPDPYYSGLIDDFKVYDYALEKDEVQKLAAEAYEAIKNQQIYENNCFVVNTSFYSDNDEIFSYSAGNDDVYISDRQYSNGNASFTINGALNKDVSNITAYAAQYDENGALAGLSLKKLSDDDITSDTQTISIPVTAAENTSDVKIFVWENMEPLSEGNTKLKISSNVENDTENIGNVKLSAYAVADSETLIAQSDTVSLSPLENKDVSMTLNTSDIPEGTKKIVVRINTGEDEDYNAATLYCDVVSPVAAPADSGTTTNGAHDPSIVQFPGDNTYYVYSSHHLIFTSKNLVNWKKYDFTNINAKDISPKTYSFISNNYSNTTMNGTYWAPDVIYKPEDDHPYWMYISISCGLGGRNSAISLVKSTSPLFWADESADVTDEGVVFATKETSGYITNAIDANIYTDSSDGTQYFIWGSFWGGIQAAPLTEDGRVLGIDYTSDATILNTCKNFGTSVFTQKNGAAGPEGAWMYEYGDYRYMFTSYGWLGSNYNTRMARSPLSTSFATEMGTQLLDANSVVMGTQYSKGSLSSPSGYKLIGSYRLGDGTMTVTKGDNNYYVERSSDDAHIYYGSGHNSAITSRNGESFYCSHFRKDAVEGAAILQIRKLLYTADGWPVVAAVSYAGEKEQALPVEMIYGTYDLASIGKTKMDGSAIVTSGNLTDKNYDLPVLSSKVTLNEDGTMADGLGTWTFDGDHTVELTFAKDGDTSKDEFYKSGDVMTLYALYGYDKDEKEPVIGLTGTDQNHITQLAKKSMANTYKTPVKAAIETEPVSILKSAGGNPELGFDSEGNTVYGGDPAATVIDTNGDGEGDTVYLIVGHDTASDESYVMPNWVLYTSQDMKSWEYKGVIMNATDISWRSNNTSAWAGQMTPYNGKYYFYYCTWDKTASGKQSIGVAVADKPEGPYTDPLGKPLVSGDFTTPESNSHDDIDPTVLIDKDEDGVEHRYLAWGNTRYYIAELNEDMVSIKDIDGDGEVTMHKDVKERKIKSMNGGVYTEAPWLYKRDGKFYLFYAMNWREEMAYAMADDLFGRYDYKQTIMPPSATANTNHPSVIDFKGKTYFIYHNGALPHGSGFRRSVCIQELEFDENGYVIPLTETSIGLTGTASTIVTSDGKYLGHNSFRNSSADSSYPLKSTVTVSASENGYNTAWELMQPKSVPAGENADNYVSIQSVNKPGLYIASTGSGVTLTQDADGKQGEVMTFKTVKGLDGNENTVSFKSITDDKYLTVLGDTITLSYGTNAAACSFTIGEATQRDVGTVKVAEIEGEPDPDPDVECDFNSASTGTIMYINTSDQGVNTTYPGARLYIGTRGSGAAQSSNWAIASGVGVDNSNALVMNSGSFVSANRGPRVQLATPVIPNGCTVTGKVSIKLGSSSAQVFYGDSTGTQATAAVPGVSADSWAEVKVTIENDNDLYIRTMYVNDEVVKTDYVDQFPVFWGTSTNDTGYKVYFDNFSVKTTTASGETATPKPVTLPSPDAEYTFDETLADSVSGLDATLTGSTVSADATATSVVYSDGVDGKAVEFTGAGSYGLCLPTVPDGSNYTISFDAKVNTAAKYSPWVFLANYNGTTLKGGDEDAQWVSIAPMGWQEALTSGPMIWSRNVPDGKSWNDVYTASNNSITEGTWHNITVAASGATAVIYVDKTKVAEGAIADIIDDTTKIYLGVNNWDTPLDGAIDNLRIYNSTLSAKQIQLIGTETE